MTNYVKTAKRTNFVNCITCTNVCVYVVAVQEGSMDTFCEKSTLKAHKKDKE